MRRRKTPMNTPLKLPVIAALLLLQYSARALDPAASAKAVDSLKAYLAAPSKDRQPVDQQSFAAVPLSRDDAAAARELLVDDHAARIRKEREQEMKDRKLKEGRLE